jgi:hypothetical protein
MAKLRFNMIMSLNGDIEFLNRASDVTNVQTVVDNNAPLNELEGIDTQSIYFRMIMMNTINSYDADVEENNEHKILDEYGDGELHFGIIYSVAIRERDFIDICDSSSTLSKQNAVVEYNKEVSIRANRERVQREEREETERIEEENRRIAEEKRQKAIAVSIVLWDKVLEVQDDYSKVQNMNEEDLFMDYADDDFLDCSEC